jgi:hypothetical protein
MSDFIDVGHFPKQGDDGFDLIVDGDQGDMKVRPCRPSQRPFLEAERAKLIKYGLLKLPDQPKQDEQK